MKKCIIFLLFILLSFNSYSKCLTEIEYEKISNSLKSIKEAEGDSSLITNMIDCNRNSLLDNLVCQDNTLVAAFHYLSIAHIYAYENATHTQVEDYSTYNDDYKIWFDNLIKDEEDKQIALRKLCYVMKDDTETYYGGDLHYEPPKFHEVIASKENKNGVVVHSLLRIIYLGKNCDVQTSDKRKGSWYKKNNQFIVKLDEMEPLIFNQDSKVSKSIENLNCKEE